jgi:hypothetical protein
LADRHVHPACPHERVSRLPGGVRIEHSVLMRAKLSAATASPASDLLGATVEFERRVRRAAPRQRPRARPGRESRREGVLVQELLYALKSSHDQPRERELIPRLDKIDALGCPP